MIRYNEIANFFYSDLINDKEFFSCFATKHQGDGRRVSNILNFLKSEQIDYKKIVLAEQIHSINIEVFSSSSSELIEKIADVDGLITKEKKVVLRVISADCLPMIFVDKKNKIIGISHQGWRGSIKKMAQQMVKKMIDIGAEKQEIKVAIGPGIGPCCYSIPEDRYYQFKAEYNGYSDKIFQFRQNQIFLNLLLLNYLQLKEVGVAQKNIDFFPFCTRCDKKRFFSYRRDKKEDYGEMFSLVMMS